MTDSFDEFEQESFDPSEPSGGMESEPPRKMDVKGVLNKPVVKLVIIVGVVGIAIAGALGSFSSDEEIKSSRLVRPPSMKEAPGGTVTPFFAEQNKMANDQRVKEALSNKGSAMPTPMGKSIDMVEMEALTEKNSMAAFHVETERLKREMRAEQRQNTQKLQVLQKQMQQRAEKKDDSLAKAMQKQLQQLMESWSPMKMKLVNGVEPLTTTNETDVTKGSLESQTAVVQTLSPKEPKTLVPAGTVNYAQLLTEANSDVPGPIMVQILSGPLSGGRAIGVFKVMYEHLLLTFNLAVYKGKEYSINAIALNPDTTLGAMATDVDHRYFKRILLPAAASFVAEFSDALSSAGAQTTVVGESVVVNEVEKGYKEAAFEGLAGVGNTVSRFFEQEAARTKTLVRVETGTAMGLFFLSSVKEKREDNLMEASENSVSGSLANAYNRSGYGGMPKVSSFPNAPSRASMKPASAGIKTPSGNVTVYK